MSGLYCFLCNFQYVVDIGMIFGWMMFLVVLLVFFVGVLVIIVLVVVFFFEELWLCVYYGSDFDRYVNCVCCFL